MNFDWADLAFASKKPLSELNAIFIMAPRELSVARFKQLVKTYLPQGNIILGLAQEDFVLGFDNQPQFRTLKLPVIESIIAKVDASGAKHTISTLTYPQRDTKFLLEKLKFQKVLLINGSWQHSFHFRPEYYAIVNSHTPYEMLSPFTDEAEAKGFAGSVKFDPIKTGTQHFEADLMAIAQTVATHSYDHTMQTGVALAKRMGGSYELLATSYNGVVPYQTYAMHHGATRELNFSPMHDLNHYDTNHAEVEMIIKAGKDGIDLRGTTLFINLLPCPTCARMFTSTDIAEFVYREDHSDGYAVRMLELAGKTVRRLV